MNQIIADYLKAVESANAPDRDELIDLHSDLIDDLKSFFANHDQMKAAREAPDEEKLLEQYPEFADQLREFFADKRKIEEIARG